MLTSTTGGRTIARTLLAAACAAPVTARAQAAPAAAWEPWIGCWAADAPGQALAFDTAAVNRRVCVLPAGRPTAVEVRRYEGAREVGRDTLDASGERRTSAREGCRGWEQAEFSADRRRVFTRSEYTCGAVSRVAHGVLAITPAGEWLDVRSVSAAGAPAAVQVAQYHPAAASAVAELAALTRDRGLSLDAARRAAGAPITAANVAEAVQKTSAPTVSSWVAASGQRFGLDGRQLLALKAAGVPGEVTDMMIAVSNPGVFAVNAGAPLGDGNTAERAERNVAGRTRGAGVLAPWGLRSGFGYWDPYWGSTLGYGYGYGYGYGRGLYGYGFGPGFYPGGGVFVGAAPVAVVRSSQPPVRLTRGAGYSWSGDAEGGRQARPRSDDSPRAGSASGSYGGASSSGSGSRSSGGASSSGGSSDGGRAAKPRP